MHQPFKFKQFTVQQDRAAMKIGTDGVLLGAWASLDHQPETILDIGTGTGVIALMMAQRSNSFLIDALEVEGAAYEQAVENFEASNWGDRLFCYHASLEEFVQEAASADVDDMEEPMAYDLIVCNPPFYSENHSSSSPQRNRARSMSALPFPELLEAFSCLLTPNGQCAVIIPSREESEFLEMAMKYSLHPRRKTRVKGNPQAPEKRTLLQLGYGKGSCHEDILILENNRHDYTPDYVTLTKDFYLKM